MHQPINPVDPWTWLGLTVIITTAAASVGSVIGMLINVKNWVNKKNEERARHHEADYASIDERLKMIESRLRTIEYIQGEVRKDTVNILSAGAEEKKQQ